MTGFIRDTEDELVDAVGRLTELDRRQCRAAAEHRFSPAAMADGYEHVYRRLLEGGERATTRPAGHARVRPLPPDLGIGLAAPACTING